MAKYDQPRIAQLMISRVPDNLSIKDYRYIMTATTPEAKKNYVSRKQIFRQNKTEQIEIFYDSAIVQVDIYLDNIWQAGYKLRHYKKNAIIAYDQTELKSTVSLNSKTKDNIKELKVSQNAELDWKLIKKEQTFDSLLREIYRNVPSYTELDVFRHANAHLSDLQDLNLNNKVKPGQIILVTNKKNSKELSEYKKTALEAERIYQILCKDKKFDPIFFANNYELLMDFYELSSQVAKAKIEYMKTVEGHKEEYCKPPSVNVPYEATNTAAIYSEKTDKMFKDAEVKRVETKLVNELKTNLEKLQAAYALEVKNKTRLANDKHYDKFKKENYAYHKKIENLLAKDLMTLHKNEEYAKTLKNLVKDTSGVRSAEFQGG